MHELVCKVQCTVTMCCRYMHLLHAIRQAAYSLLPAVLWHWFFRQQLCKEPPLLFKVRSLHAVHLQWHI